MTLNKYDDWNRPVETTDSRTGTTVTAFMSATNDAVKSVTDPGNRTTAFQYDNRGRRTHVDAPNSVDANNTALENITITTYNPDGTVAQVSGGQTYPVSYTYDYADRMKTMTTTGEAGNAITAWNYSATTGQLESKRYASNLQGSTGTGPDYDYTAAGRLESRQWARSLPTQSAVRVQASYSYSYGLLTGITYNDGTPNVVLDYDAFTSNNAHIPGDLETIAQNGATWTLSYDPDNLRLLSETHPVGGTAVERILARQYDNLGRPSGFTLGTTADPDLDNAVAYDFDTAGRLNEVTSPAGTFTYGFVNQAPHLIETVTGPADMVVTHQWRADRDALLWKKNEVDSVTVSQFTYGVNPIGQRENVVTTGTAFGNANRGWQWGYDALGQATKAAHAADNTLDHSYAYDSIGNRLQSGTGVSPAAITTYTPNLLNQYSSIENPQSSIVNPVHDLDGNLREDAGINALTYGLKYEWDAENRITAVRKADDTLLVTYTYDPFSRRIRKTTTAAAYQGASDIAYLYEGWNVIAEYEITSGPAIDLAKTYTWGIDLSGTLQGAGGVGGLLAVSQITNNSITDNFYPTYDGNGNISEYIKDDGTTAAHFEYDPFGRLVYSTGTPALFTYRFSTKPQDFETGLFYYGYRWYDPVTGRWPSRDPIQEQGGINLYGFVRNNVANWIDLLGMVNIPQLAWDSQPKWKDEKGNMVQGKNKTHFMWSLNKCTLTVFVPILFTTTGMKKELGTNYDAQAELRRLLDLHHEDPKSPYAIMNKDIARAWNDKFKFCCYCACKDGIKIEIKIGPGDNEKYSRDQRANIGLFKIPGQRAGVNQLYWNIGLPNMAAHEIGHWLGNPDEYQVDGPRFFPELNADKKWVWKDYSVADPDSVMVKETGEARARHFKYISQRFRNSSCKIVKQSEPCPENQ